MRRRFFIAMMICVLRTQLSHAELTVTVSPKTNWGIWEGWGTSLCWWANVFGARDDLADLLFTTNFVRINDEFLPGLGFNIARYNAGACTTNPVGDAHLQLSPHIPPFKQIQGFWRDDSSADPASASWVWDVDANQRAMLLKAKARGADHLELFSNSPLWWMCANHNPSGHTNGTADNLLPQYYQAHAAYLATIAQQAQTRWGVTFETVEPFNEPSADWWKADGRQEGCHFSAGTQAAVLALLRSELNQRGLRGFQIAASDESLYEQALNTWTSFDSATRSLVDRVNVHGYQYDGGRRDRLFAAVAGKRLWNSEYGDGDASGNAMVTNLNLDFHHLHPTAWCYWQPLDYGGWGLIQANPGRGQIGAANPKYFRLAHYTRHIRAGMAILDCRAPNTVAAYDADAKRLVLVTWNPEPAQQINFRLSDFSRAAGPVKRWATKTDAQKRYATKVEIAVTNKALSVDFDADMIQTFEVQNVER